MSAAQRVALPLSTLAAMRKRKRIHRKQARKQLPEVDMTKGWEQAPASPIDEEETMCLEDFKRLTSTPPEPNRELQEVKEYLAELLATWEAACERLREQNAPVRETIPIEELLN